MRVIVHDHPPPEPYDDDEEEEPEPSLDMPQAIVLPPGQSARERDAFLRWFQDRWGAFIHGKLLAWRGMREESAKDLAQRVLLVICAKVDPREPPVHMQGFLDRVIHHEVLNHRRPKRLDIAPDADADAAIAPGPSPESEADRAEHWAKIERYLTFLSPEEAEVFEGKERMGMTFEAIAGATGRSRATVARQHARALEKLAEMARASERETELGARRR